MRVGDGKDFTCPGPGDYDCAYSQFDPSYTDKVRFISPNLRPGSSYGRLFAHGADAVVQKKGATLKEKESVKAERLEGVNASSEKKAKDWHSKMASGKRGSGRGSRTNSKQQQQLQRNKSDPGTGIASNANGVGRTNTIGLGLELPVNRANSGHVGVPPAPRTALSRQGSKDSAFTAATKRQQLEDAQRVRVAEKLDDAYRSTFEERVDFHNKYSAMGGGDGSRYAFPTAVKVPIGLA